MSYIGSTPTSQNFIAGTDYFNGNGSTVAFTLSRSVNTVDDIEVGVNNVEQIPSGYTVSGTTLTFSAAPSAGTSNIYVRYLSTTLQSITITGTLAVASGGTGVTTSTGTGSVVLNTSPTLVTPALGTPSALVGTNITGTASGLTAGNVTTNANLTGAVTSTGNATSLGSFTSAQLLGALSDETGTGSAVFATSPTLVTPILGTPTSGNLANCTFPTLNQNTTGTASNVTGTVAVANGGTGSTTLTLNNVVLGNGTSAVQLVAPSTSGNVLTSNGTTWQSTTPASSAPTTAQVLSATAGASVGAVGTYALLGNASGAASIVAGTTYAGSGLAYAGFAKGNAGFASASVEQNYSAGAGSTVSGTWRAMGSNTAGFGCGTSARAATLFLRTV